MQTLTDHSIIAKYRAGVEVKVDLVELLSKAPHLKNLIYCIDTRLRQNEEDTLINKVAKKSGITNSNNPTSGIIDISEFIELSIEEILYIPSKERESVKRASRKYQNPLITPEMEKTIETFEKENVPKEGPAKTLIGEIFRACQFIRYRAFNDGDLPWVISSPSFISHIFILSQLDNIEYDSNRMVNGEYPDFTFNDTLLHRFFPCGLIFLIESRDAFETDFLKAGLLELLESGQIEDKPNEWDSRTFTKI
jgi:hypothetical protein